MEQTPSDLPAEAPTIYLVERNGRQQEAIRNKLRKHGFQVLVAHNPLLAVQRFSTHGFDALIVDVSRTQDEGLEAVRKITRDARRRGKTCPCIVLLKPDQKPVARRLQAEATAQDTVVLLYRPVRLLELLATVKSLVQSRPDPADSDRQKYDLAGA